MKQFVRSLLVVWALLIALSVSVLMVAAQTTRPQTTAPDNTRVNQRDRAKGAPTADQQKDNRSDLEITQGIRQKIIADKGLSTYAHNVKIITQNGHVTLKGPVRTEEEKKTVEAKASEVAGTDHVKSEIQIAAKAGGKKTTKPTSNNN